MPDLPPGANVALPSAALGIALDGPVRPVRAGAQRLRRGGGRRRHGVLQPARRPGRPAARLTAHGVARRAAPRRRARGRRRVAGKPEHGRAHTAARGAHRRAGTAVRPVPAAADAHPDGRAARRGLPARGRVAGARGGPGLRRRAGRVGARLRCGRRRRRACGPDGLRTAPARWQRRQCADGHPTRRTRSRPWLGRRPAQRWRHCASGAW